MPALARAGDPATSEQATVHVIDDDVSLRDALSLLLPSIGLGARTYASVQEFLDAGAHDAPGCIVLDVRLPGISGLDFQSRREGFGVRLPIVLMTGHSDVPMSVRAMKAGAIEFLAKPFRDKELLDAVEQALCKARTDWHARLALSSLRARFASLTPRERQVLAHVVNGMLNKQIASALGISEVTVKAHRGQIMRKMKASSVLELARMAEQLNFASKTSQVTETRAGANTR